MNRGLIFQTGDIEAPLSYNADLPARYQQVRDELEAGHAFPSFADVSNAYRDWLDKQGVTQQMINALQDYPLPPEQQSAMMLFLRQWDGNASTLLEQLEHVLQQVKHIQHDYHALTGVLVIR